MDIFFQLLSIFAAGCLIGWVIEFFFRRIVHKKWINPGFLTGPCLPLYGSGLTGLFLLCRIDVSFIENNVLKVIVVIFVMTVTMTLIEYITGLFFLKVMNVRLWDYRDRKWNIDGLICPLFSLAWGAIGALYYFILDPVILDLSSKASSDIGVIFALGMFLGIFVIDLCYSFHVVTKIRKWALDNNIEVKYETLKENIREKAGQLKHKQSFIFPFVTKADFSEMLEHYKKNFESRIKKIK